MPAKRARPQPKTIATAEVTAAPPSALSIAFAALGRSPLGYVLASIVALLPCYWQPRIQAGDLSSHIYNSWLAQLIETQKLQGLTVVPQVTNVLFDLLLSGFFRALGPDLAQRFAVSIAVLVFVWGAFAFASVAAGKRAWPVLPCIVMLAYGWVFHMGFFDFYLGLGLSFCGLAAAWDPTPKRLALAAPFFALAFFAHALAFAWGAAFLVYLVAAKWLGPSRRMELILGGLAGLIIARIAVSAAWPTRWAADQLLLVTGADQLRLFDDKYFMLFVALLAVWAIEFALWLHAGGSAALRGNPALPMFLLSAAGVFFLPGGIQLPGYRHALVYIAERMSLGAAICLCAVLASAPWRPFARWAMGAVAAAFFVFVFHDVRALNVFEAQIQQTVSSLPPGQRVVLGLDDESLTRINAVTHMIDRACVGRCFSYANYEPATWQFRVRALAPNPYVTGGYQDSFLMQVGQYKVKPSDLPLYQVTIDNAGNLALASLEAGAPNGIKLCRVLPALL